MLFAWASTSGIKQDREKWRGWERSTALRKSPTRVHFTPKNRLLGVSDRYLTPIFKLLTTASTRARKIACSSCLGLIYLFSIAFEKRRSIQSCKYLVWNRHRVNSAFISGEKSNLTVGAKWINQYAWFGSDVYFILLPSNCIFE